MDKSKLLSYDNYIVAFSGGKDSTACYLHLLERGIPANSIEIWHQDIDGREGSELMDWPVTADYCRKFAEHFGSPIYYSWKVGGFEREMLRENALTAPTRFETPSGEVKQVGGTSGKLSTRRMFPQVSANLSVRWCSSYLKIDVCSTAIRNQNRFNDSKTLVLSGERAEESAARAKYNEFEPDRSDNRSGRKARHVDRWRAVLSWSEKEVWDIIERWQLRVHPAYYLGWGRTSCVACIFGSCNQWASLFKIMPDKLIQIAEYEEDFGKTIHRKESVIDRAIGGTPYDMDVDMVAVAKNKKYTLDIEIKNWVLPSGAFGESCGPT